MTVKMAPKRRRPRRIAKRIEQRHGARSFEGAEAIGKAQRWEKATRTARGIVYMCRAAAALIQGDVAAQVTRRKKRRGSTRTGSSFHLRDVLLAMARSLQRAPMRSETRTA